MSKVKVKEEKGGNPALTTFGGLLIGLGILDFGLSWTGTNITAFWSFVTVYSNCFRFYRSSIA